jgi:DNA-binding NarL/FixJ family response regulator
VRRFVIGVAVLASSPMARARLEALVGARPGLRLASPPVAGTGDHGIAASVGADVLLMDGGARPTETVLRALPQAPPLPPVVLLAGDLAPAAFLRLLRAGVRAILPRDASAPEIVAGIEAVAAGLVVLHPSAPVAVARAPGARRARDEAGTDPLTPRELEILTMIAEGMGNRAIAQSLGISTHTVKFHVAAILDKLNARSRTEAVTTGLRQGLLMV